MAHPKGAMAASSWLARRWRGGAARECAGPNAACAWPQLGSM